MPKIKRRKRRASQEAYENFVQVWNRSSSKAEVAQATGLPMQIVSSWAHRLRKLKVPLNRLHNRRKNGIDVQRLIMLAKKAARRS